MLLKNHIIENPLQHNRTTLNANRERNPSDINEEFNN